MTPTAECLPRGAAAAPAPVNPPRLDSRQLLCGQPEVQIQHGAQVYRLRLTALGKLILTK